MSGKKLLLVEGVDDRHVVLNLQGSHGIRVVDREEVHDLGGIERLLESLPVQLKAADGGVLGIVVDADQDLAARWQAISHCLSTAGYGGIPEKPDSDGLILSPPSESLLPRFGAWLMPDNSTKGILEDFLRFLVPTEDVLLPLAEEALQALPEQRFSENDRPKALIHTWLAWQKEPGRPFGQAITARFLQPDAKEAYTFVEWLKHLFSE
jgi:hypothetical protein